MGVAFAHLLLLLAPVLNTNGLVGFHHICNLELGIHLLEEETVGNMREDFSFNKCVFVCVQEREGGSSMGSLNPCFIRSRCHLPNRERA